MLSRYAERANPADWRCCGAAVIAAEISRTAHCLWYTSIGKRALSLIEASAASEAFAASWAARLLMHAPVGACGVHIGKGSQPLDGLKVLRM
jgi:hypothetical protein